MKRTLLTLAIAMSFSGFSPALYAEDFPEPLAAEPIPHVEVLPKSYPEDWVFAHDTNFFSLLDGKVVILDVASENRHYKGMLGAGQFASFLPSSTRPELYVAETFYSRRLRGERTDAITIYDKETLNVVGEIVLPGAKRGQMVTQKNSFQFTDGERLGLVFNFTPAASVTVVDFEKRAVLNEIQIPGCSLVYPTGKVGFSTFCGDGTMVTFDLDKEGKVQKRHATEPFNDISNDPLFMKTAVIDGINYFVSFKGRVQPVNLKGAKAKVKGGWSLIPEEQADENWRPAGWYVLSADGHGNLYVLMQKDGAEGSHKDGGSEVWVYDVDDKRRVRRIQLQTWGVTIEATKGDTAYLAVVNADMAIDVYDARSGELIRTIGGRAAETPFVLHAVE